MLHVGKDTARNPVMLVKGACESCIYCHYVVFERKEMFLQYQ